MIIYEMQVSKDAIKKIRQLQKDEGYEPCFKTDKVHCGHQFDCCWQSMCVGELMPRKGNLS